MGIERTIGSRIVRKTQIAGGGNWTSFSVWEPTSVGGSGGHSHSTITTIDGKWYGRLGTQALPAELDALPALTNERIDAVQAHYDRLYLEAYTLIETAFPSAAAGRQSMGEIDII